MPTKLQRELKAVTVDIAKSSMDELQPFRWNWNILG